jgi:hypothetical protein
MHDAVSPALPETRTVRSIAFALALVFGALTVLMLILCFQSWQGLLAKLDWWEAEDWSMPTMLLVVFQLPLALALAAITRSLGALALPSRESRWAVRLAGLPLLVLPAMLVRSFGPIVYSEDTPGPEEHTARLVQLGVYAAIALVIAGYGWVAPRATFRGMVRTGAMTIGGVLLLDFAWMIVSLARAGMLVQGAAVLVTYWPLFAACGLALALTRRRA